MCGERVGWGRGYAEKLSRGSGQLQSLNIQPLAVRERPRRAAAPPDGNTNRPFLPLRPRPRSCSIAADVSPPSSSSSSSEEPSPPSGRKPSTAGQPSSGIKRPRVAAHFSHHSSPVVLPCGPRTAPPPFRTSRVLSFLAVVDTTVAWRARRSSSFTPRRRDSVNGRVSESSSGTRRRGSSWGAPAPVGVSTFLCVRACFSLCVRVYVCARFFFLTVFPRRLITWLVPSVEYLCLSDPPLGSRNRLCARLFPLARNETPFDQRCLIDRKDSRTVSYHVSLAFALISCPGAYP